MDGETQPPRKRGLTISEVVSACYTAAMRDSPRAKFYWPRDPRSYRERLDEQKVNYLGEPIPRITIVRRNLYKMQKPSRKPNLPA